MTEYNVTSLTASHWGGGLLSPLYSTQCDLNFFMMYFTGKKKKL